MDARAALLTAELAAATSAALFALATPLAWWLATTRSRARPFVEAVVALPLVLPPTVVGFYLLLAMGPRSPLGAAWEGLTGSGLPFTFTGLWIASIVCNLPFAVRPMVAAFGAVERRLVEASWCLGASPVETFHRVVLPLAWPGVVTSLVLTFVHTVGEFGVVLMIGGNVPGVTRTLSVAIYDDVQALDYAAAGSTSAVLLGFAFAVLSLVYGLQRRILWT